jgi:uncharacterized Zn finger protein (UPF0148 family)
MNASPQGPACPRCGCQLLWNGRAMSCIACSYLSKDVKSEKRMPAVKERKRNRGGETPSV